MTTEIPRGVLAFTKRVGLDRSNDFNAFGHDLGIVHVHIFDSHHDGMRGVNLARRFALGDDDGAFAGVQLHAVIGDSESLVKTEVFTQPFRGREHIRVGEFGDDGGVWDGSI